MGGCGCQNPIGDDLWDCVMEVRAALTDGRQAQSGLQTYLIRIAKQSKFTFCATSVACNLLEA